MEGKTKKKETKNIHEGHRSRLRERFLNNGAASMEPHVMLELLLCYAIPRGDTNPIAHRLLVLLALCQQCLMHPMKSF